MTIYSANLSLYWCIVAHWWIHKHRVWVLALNLKLILLSPLAGPLKHIVLFHPVKKKIIIITCWKVKQTCEHVLIVSTWIRIQNKKSFSNLQVFTGNRNANSVVTNMFPTPILGSVVRISPTGWQTTAALRLEILGCLLQLPP